MWCEAFVDAHTGAIVQLTGTDFRACSCRCELRDLLGYARGKIRVSDAEPRSSHHEAEYHSLARLRDPDQRQDTASSLFGWHSDGVNNNRRHLVRLPLRFSLLISYL